MKRCKNNYPITFITYIKNIKPFKFKLLIDDNDLNYQTKILPIAY